MTNTKYLEQKGLEPYDWFLLQMLVQNASDDMSEWLQIYLDDKHMKRLLAMDLLTTVKKKRVKDHEFSTLRVSKKGREVWRNAKIPKYKEEDEQLLEYLVKQYEKVEKPIGNREKIKELLAWFRMETGYSRKQLYKAVAIFLKVEQEDKGGKYIPSLENLIWKGGTVFSKQPKLSESRLYQFIIDKKELLNAYQTGKKGDQ